TWSVDSSTCMSSLLLDTWRSTWSLGDRTSTSSTVSANWATPSRSNDSCSADDHQLIAFGVGDPPAIRRLAEEPAAGCDGCRETRRRQARRHSQLEVGAVALPASLRLRCVDLLEHQYRVQPPRIVDVGGFGSAVVDVPECGDPERPDRGDVGGVEE